MSADSPLPPIGFLAVEVNIHRPPGDPFNPQTWPFPILHERVPGSREEQIVTKEQYDNDFYDRFEAAARRLADRGAVGILTSCGFLVMAQKKLAERLPVPIAASALLQIPSILAFLPPSQLIGVLTYDSERLNDTHLKELSIDPARVRIAGAPPDGNLRGIIQRGIKYDHAIMEAELVAGAVELMEGAEKEGKKMGALVLECTQMPPYAEAIQKKIGVPVYDVYSLGRWFYGGIVKRSPETWSCP